VRGNAEVEELGNGAPIPLPGVGLAKGRVQPDHCSQALSCRRLAREDGGTTLATHLRSVLNIIRIVLTRSRQEVRAGLWHSHIEVVLAERCRSREELHNPDGIMLMYADSGHCRSHWQLAPGRLWPLGTVGD